MLLQYWNYCNIQAHWPDSIYAWFYIVSDTCHPVPYYLNSDMQFLTMSNQYCNPEPGFEPGSSSECLLEFDTHSKVLGHHGRLVEAYFLSISGFISKPVSRACKFTHHPQRTSERNSTYQKTSAQVCLKTLFKQIKYFPAYL